MKIAQLFLLFAIIFFSAQMPIQAHLGLRSKTIIGLFAGAGSLLASGAAHVVDSFNKDSLADARTRIVSLEDQITAYKAKELSDMNFNQGLVFGTIATAMVCTVIVALAHSSAPQAKNEICDKAEITNIKA